MSSQFTLFSPPSLSWRELWAGVDLDAPLGAVYTRPEVVSLILDLIDYRPECGRLRDLSVLEPAAGEGAFVLPLVDRLLESEVRHAGPVVDWNAPELERAIQAVDLSARAILRLRERLELHLTLAGCPSFRARHLAESWAQQGDFLLLAQEQRFQRVVGNPPYVRIEDLPGAVLAEYRRRHPTMVGRADLYIAFFERGLNLLAPEGQLAFLSANRFAKNQYGRVLRRRLAEEFHVRLYLDLEETQPFADEVSAYPAITLVDREQGKPTLAGRLTDLSAPTLECVRKEAREPSASGALLHAFADWYPRGEPWSATDRREQEFLFEVERRFLLLEESAPGTRVGIGVATGADRIFVLAAPHPDIEPSRLLPLAMAQDLSNQEIRWSGHLLVNPFEADGSLVDLTRYPGLARYLRHHEQALRARHVARRQPEAWYRTIDRVSPTLQSRSKLLIPDIKGEAVLALDEGDYYPHHNTYHITSEGDLRVLKTLLRSSFVLRQVRAYSVALRGGYPRFQAQTLRRVRIPALDSLSEKERESLRALASSPSQEAIDQRVEALLAARGFEIPASQG